MGGKPRTGRAGGARGARGSADEVLGDWSPGARRIALTVARTLALMIDGVRESGDRAAGTVSFRRVEAGRFCFVEEADGATVRLGFEHGYALPDLVGAFEPGGRGRVRYLHLTRAAQVTTRPVKIMLSMALYDDQTQGFRSRVSSPRPRR